MSLQQELTTMQEVSLDNDDLQKVHYPDLGTQYLQMDDVQMAALQEHQKSENRVSFLVEFYKRQLLQHSIIMVLFLLGLGRWLNIIVVKHHRWDSSFRWTWWVVLVTLIILQLSLPLVRKCRIMVSQQKSIFYLQTILISFLLIGITGAQRGNWFHFRVGLSIALVISGLIIHDLLQLLMVSYNRTQYYKIFIKFSIVGSLILNFIVALFTSEINREYPIVEGIAIYFLFYTDQLNESLLLHPSQLAEDYTIGERLKNMFRDGQVITSVERNHCIINKDVFLIIGASVIYLTVVIVTIIIGNVTSIIILIISSVSLLSFIVETRVASRSLQQEDVYFAVCLTYLDIISPIKDIFRSNQ